MKTIFTLLSALLLFTSCEKEELPSPELDLPDPVQYTIVVDNFSMNEILVKDPTKKEVQNLFVTPDGWQQNTRTFRYYGLIEEIEVTNSSLQRCIVGSDTIQQYRPSTVSVYVADTLFRRSNFEKVNKCLDSISLNRIEIMKF